MNNALSEEIRKEALRIARRFIKENKKELHVAAIRAYKKELNKNLDRIAKDALERTCLYIDS